MKYLTDNRMNAAAADKVKIHRPAESRDRGAMITFDMMKSVVVRRCRSLLVADVNVREHVQFRQW
jgi:hypothetical protein